MGRVSRRQTAVRHTAKRVRFLSVLVCMEVGGVIPPQTLDVCGLVGVSATSMLLLCARQALRSLLQNRYLRRSRGFVPKSRHWGWYVVNELPDHQWRVFMRMSRATYERLRQLLSSQVDASLAHRRRRPSISLDVQMKVALFRLGHDGNSSCKWILSRRRAPDVLTLFFLVSVLFLTCIFFLCVLQLSSVRPTCLV